MDDATMKLINKRLLYQRPKEPFTQEYEERILETTRQLLKHPRTGALQDAFEMYVSECIHQFKQLDRPKHEDAPVLEHDKLLYPSKKVNVLLKKNAFSLYGKKDQS